MARSLILTDEDRDRRIPVTTRTVVFQCRKQAIAEVEKAESGSISMNMREAAAPGESVGTFVLQHSVVVSDF